jgi:hypothetical protein
VDTSNTRSRFAQERTSDAYVESWISGNCKASGPSTASWQLDDGPSKLGPFLAGTGDSVLTGVGASFGLRFGLREGPYRADLRLFQTAPEFLACPAEPADHDQVVLGPTEPCCLTWPRSQLKCFLCVGLAQYGVRSPSWCHGAFETSATFPRFLAIPLFTERSFERAAMCLQTQFLAFSWLMMNMSPLPLWPRS